MFPKKGDYTLGGTCCYWVVYIVLAGLVWAGLTALTSCNDWCNWSSHTYRIRLHSHGLRCRHYGNMSCWYVCTQELVEFHTYMALNYADELLKWSKGEGETRVVQLHSFPQVKTNLRCLDIIEICNYLFGKHASTRMHTHTHASTYTHKHKCAHKHIGTHTNIHAQTNT